MDVDETSNDNMDAVPASSRWSNLERFLSTRSSLSAPAYEENPANFGILQEHIKILVIGAGGLGCELLKDLGMMGFRNIDVIDMDTIDLSNLNRQFLFRTKDIGRPKAKVAAEFINRRIKGCNVVPHYSKIQDFDSEFYGEFNVVVCGLDSVVARRWINGMLLSLVCYTDDGEVDKTSIIPLVDGGTEGFKGNARVVLPRKTACIECNIDLFPKQVNYPLCTIAETPRLPEHCVEYARIIQWPQQQPFGANVGIDGDDPAHIQWIYKRSLERARQYDIAGITYRLTQGVVKHIIPAVASTNAVIAAMCATEVWKVVTFCYTPMDNYTVFNDSEGVFTYTFQAERKEDCFACSQKPIQLKVDFNITLKELIELIKENDRLQLKEPSLTTFINGNNKTLYMSNIPSLEEATKGNLSLSLLELGLEDGCQLQITDSTSPQYILLKLISNNA